MVVSCNFLRFLLLVVCDIVVYYFVDMFEVLIENLMNECGLRHKLLTSHVRLNKQYCMLKAILALLFIVLQERPNFFEVTFYETCDYCIFILIYPISIEVFIFCEHVFDLILNAEISIVR